jgi:hypothetical protein
MLRLALERPRGREKKFSRGNGKIAVEAGDSP